jgi:tyrosine-protein phosphatase SIW14
MKSTITLSLARLSRGMKQRNGVRIAALSILLTGMIAAGLILGLRDSFAQSGGPTNSPGYSKVDDFLNGRRHILHNDDLVIGFNYTDEARPRKVLFSAGTASSVPAIQVSSRSVPNGQGSCQDPAGYYYDTIDYDYPDSALPIPARADHEPVREKISVEIPNFGRVNDHYYRGAQPTGDAYRQLAALGVKMVVDLRNDATEYAKPLAEQSGLRYINLPLDDKRYPPADAATRFLEIVADPANWPVYVHCKGGRHRTGAMTAVYRMTVDGWDVDRAYEEMKGYGFYIHWGHECYKDYVYDYYRDLQADRQRRHSMIVQSALLRFSSSCHVGLTPALKRINATHNFFSGAPNSHAKHWSYSLAALGQIDFGVVAVEIEMRSSAFSKKNVLITSYLTT